VSKATGVNLVQAACRLAAGASLSDLALPGGQSLGQVSVNAAVLPFARFPGADAVLGPEMRSTGEVMASASDLPTAFAKAERAAGRRLPTEGTAFLSVRDEDKAVVVQVARALDALGFKLIATAGTAHTLAAAGLVVEHVRKVTEDGEGPSVVDLVRRGRCDLVVNTPQGSGARTDGYLIREAALLARVPCVTTISGAAAAVEAIAHAQDESRSASRSESVLTRRALKVAGNEAGGPYTLLRVERGELDPGIPGQFFMLEAPGRLLPRPMSLCLATASELGFLIDPIGPGARALCSLAAGETLRVLGPLGNGFRLDVPRPSAAGSGSRLSRTYPTSCGPPAVLASAAPGTPRRQRSSRAPRWSLTQSL
jgi:hypothetical protein